MALFAVLAGLVLGAGCGSSSSGDPGATTAAASPQRPTVTAPAPPTKARSRPRARAADRTGCPAAGHALDGVYHPSRLRILSPCKQAAGRVTIVRHETDGDLHIDVAVDAAYSGLLAPANNDRQHGNLVVEFMARDGGRLPESRVGDRISLTGAWVDDTQHSWNELHPVWAVSLNGGPTHTSGPAYGGSPPGDRSYNAAGDCRTPTGATCRGYGAPPPF